MFGFSPLTSLLGGAAIALALMVGTYFYGRHDGHQLALSEQRAAALERAAVVREIEGRFNTFGARMSKAFADHQGEIREHTNTIIREVPVYVTAKIDHDFPVPWSLVSLYNASASGRPVSAFAPPAGQSFGTASPVAASEFARTFAANNGQCLEWAAQVNDLIDFHDGVTSIATQGEH